MLVLIERKTKRSLKSVKNPLGKPLVGVVTASADRNKQENGYFFIPNEHPLLMCQFSYSFDNNHVTLMILIIEKAHLKTDIIKVER